MKKNVFLSLLTVSILVIIFSATTADTDKNTNTTTDISTHLIQPSDLVYQGAFRLPAGDGSDERSWSWGGTAMTYYPHGDPTGPNDEYPGSIFATGHEQYQYVSEISIPVPVISSSKNLSELNTAKSLQSFQDIRGDFLGDYVELPRVGLEYLPKQGSQTSDKIHFGWGQHFQEESDVTHGWFNLNLSNPQRAGGWYIDNQSPYSVNDYIFEIPSSWANSNTPGKLLATGRYRDGGWSGQGPSLFAYGPWNEGNPPAHGTRLDAITLLKYDSSEEVDALYDSSAHTMKNYHHSDEWSGGAWLTAGDKSTVIFVGTKGIGKYWYGFSDGTVWPDEPPYPDIPDPPHNDRGWWSSRFEAQIIFYNPDDLADVAQGRKKSYEPQPYATLNIDEYLYNIEKVPGLDIKLQKYRLGAACFDRKRGFLYIFEFRGDRENERPLAHVWKINTKKRKKIVGRR
ncbi:MAG: hypothetical protein ACE5WD_07425 [Candidatus Aminicenantia bacterium]